MYMHPKKGDETMKRVTVEVDSEMATKLKIHAILTNQSVKQYVTKLIVKDLEAKKDIRV